MVYETYHPPKTQDSTLMPLILSFGIHAAVVAFLLFWQAPVHEPADIGIETTFFGQAELEQIEGQIRENARLAEQGDDGTDDISTAAPQPSPQTTALNEELAKRQAEFEKQMAEFAAELDKIAEAEQKNFINELQAEARQNEAELNEAREAFANQDEKIKENQKELNKARQARDDAIAKNEENKRKQGGKSTSMGGEHTTPTGTAANTTQGAAGGANKNNINDIIAALQALIYRNWQVPSNASGERLLATIRVDSSGNVLSVSVSGGGNAALKDSLENAVMNSSPLSPIAGTEFRELKVGFTAK